MQINFKRISILLSSLLGLSFSLFSNAEVWKAACEDNFPPYNFKDKDKKPVGMDTEIVELVMKKAQISMNLETYPWARVVKSLENGEADFAWQFVDSKERREKFNLVGPIRDGITVFMVREDSPIRDWKTLADFKGKKVGVIREYKYTPEFDSYTGFIKEESNNYVNLVQKAVSEIQRLDVTIGDLSTLTYVLKESGHLDKVRFLPTPVKVVPRYVGFAKNEQAKIKAETFEKVLSEVKKTKEYKAIINKYTAIK